MDMDKQEGDNLCLLILDPTSTNQTDKFFSSTYSKLYQNGDLYNHFSNIKDSLTFEQSHQSVGIQFADLLAGAFSSRLKGNDLGKEIYHESIIKVIRRNPNNGSEIRRYGVMEIPKIAKRLTSFVKEAPSIYQKSKRIN